MRGLAAAIALTLLASTLHADEPTPTGRLAVVILDGWGEVKIDGVWRGLAPVRLELPAGVHRVEVPETTWHLGWSAQVEVPVDDERMLYVELSPRPGTVWLEGFPAAAGERPRSLLPP